MDVLGYLVTLANLQSISSSTGPITDLSVEIVDVGKAVEELKHLRGFNLECFRRNGYCRVGNEGKYLSNNLREILFKGGVNTKDEGLLITLYYNGVRSKDDKPALQVDEETLSYFLHKPGGEFVNKDVHDPLINHLNSIRVQPYGQL